MFKITKKSLTTLILISIILSGFSVAQNSKAAINKQFNYQGKLTNSSGVAVADGAYNIVFNLYTVAGGGTAAWTESWTNAALFTNSATTFTNDGCATGVDKMAYDADGNEATLAAGQVLWNTAEKVSAVIQSVDITGVGGFVCIYDDPYTTWASADEITNRIYVKDGLFSVMVGTITAQTVDFTASTYYLGVTIGVDSEMFPRKRIGAVPQAWNANNVVGDGYVDIDNTSTAQDALNINYNPASGTYDAMDITYGSGGGTGTALTVTQNGTGNIVNLTDNYLTSGKGIYLANSESAATGNIIDLDIAQDQLETAYHSTAGVGSTLTDNLTEANSNAGTAYTLLAVEAVSDDVFFFGNSATFDTLNFDIATAIVPTGLDLVYKYSSGKDASDVCSAWTELTETDGTTGLTIDGKITWTDPGAGWIQCELVDGQGLYYYASMQAPASTDITTAPTAYYSTISMFTGNFAEMKNAGTTKFVIDSDGNIGIGTGTPTSALDVRGTIENGLVAWWPMDEGSGATAVDYSINSHNGTITGSSCPTGYVLVPGDATYGTDDFCVMKYEASDVGGVATSDTATTPWASITQTAAITACNSASGHLITNNEWMTIARNAETQTANWANGVVGSLVSAGGGFKRGNVGITDSVSYNGSDPEFGTGRDAKAELALSNGETIWDFSGNVWEWTNDTISCVLDVCTSDEMPYDASPSSEWVEFPNLATYGSLAYDDIRPSNSAWNSTYGVGKIYTDADAAYPSGTVHAFLRGGYWSDGAYAGAFTLNLSISPACSYTNIGFRCVR